MKTIHIYRTAHGWMAAFMDEHGNPDKSIARHWGTHHLPTAFTAHASYDMVRAELAKRNPGYHVVLS